MRDIYYTDDRLMVVYGKDIVCGRFYQMYDNTIDTPEGESLILDWDSVFGYSCNLTGYPNEDDPLTLIENYIKFCIEEKELLKNNLN